MFIIIFEEKQIFHVYFAKSLTKNFVSFDFKEFHIDWNRILKNDPLKCTQSLICQIVAGAEAENKDVLPMIYLLEYVFIIHNTHIHTSINFYFFKILDMQ